MTRVLVLVLWVSLSACRPYQIIPKPIIFDEHRSQLSLRYLERHHGLIQSNPLIEPKIIIVHWTSLPDLEKAYLVYRDSEQLQFRNDDQFLEPRLNVSAHFLVDRDGSIYQLLADTLMANHVTGLNYCSIGIKNIGGPGFPLTEEQLEANIFLVKHLTKRHPIEYLIGNFEYPLFQEHAYWKNFSSLPVEARDDPGREFMERLRERVAKLMLSGPPPVSK